MLKIESKRRITARILLFVFVAMLSATALHVHQANDSANEDSCSLCLHHVRHDGHLSNKAQTIEHCVLCQLLATPYAMAAGYTAKVNANNKYIVPLTYVANYASISIGINATRAPPAVYYYTL